MHRLAATPGGWEGGSEGVVFIDQTPAPLVFLTAADTDIAVLNQALQRLPEDFPAIRTVNLLQLQQQLTIDTYAADVLRHAELIVLRLLGGRAYWSYGLEVVKAVADEGNKALVVMPGDGSPDMDLMGHSTVSLAVVNQLWRYFTEGGVDNFAHGLQFICDRTLATRHHPPAPQTIPKVGRYALPENVAEKNGWPEETMLTFSLPKESLPKESLPKESLPKAAILFYRAHYLAGNTQVVEHLAAALSQRGIEPVPIYIDSLKDPEVQQQIAHMGAEWTLVINTTSFAIAQLQSHSAGPQASQGGRGAGLWSQLAVPVLQVICSGSSQAHWQGSSLGLSPRDIAMNVALPEVDGRIITRVVSFKQVSAASKSPLQTDIVTYEPAGDRIGFVAELAARWIALGRKRPEQRKIALILANYPNRDGRMANGVGLDTPASCLEILRSLQQAGYSTGELPPDGDALMAQLAAGVTNDPESYSWRPIRQSLSLADYGQFLATLPAAVQQGLQLRWGTPAEEWRRRYRDPADWLPGQGTEQSVEACKLPIAGVQFGQVFVGIQPARGYDLDPSLNYHAPDLEPTHAYLGFYHWLRSHFGADAIVHVGKHGNLEWLPGKGIALSETCYPEVAFGPLPHFYPFIVNDPGEGAQAKRRSQAVIIDHLTPPMTRAELYGPLSLLEGLVDEYYEAQNLDPKRLPVLGEKILALLEKTSLQHDLGLADRGNLPNYLPQIDGYLCELKEAQIRDGLHIFGCCPQGTQLRDLVVAIARHPNAQHPGLSRAIARSWQLEFDPLTDDLGTLLSASDRQRLAQHGRCERGSADRGIHPTTYPITDRTVDRTFDRTIYRTVGDGVECIETYAAHRIEAVIERFRAGEPWSQPKEDDLAEDDREVAAVIGWIWQCLLPNLQHTTDEIEHLLHGLNGGYIPPGPAGAPTRNRPEVLPTGRNFYSVDIRSMPTESAWDVGRRAAEVVIENYTQTQGEYPRTLGLSVWGTSAMRTGGDDIAEALALLGVRPVWDGPSRRVVDFEILPLSALGRPRVDVTLRISGFFRDAFPNLIDLFDRAVRAVAALPESPEQNPLAAQVQQDVDYWQSQGLSADQSWARSHYRIFGSKPGAYGAGLQGLIEAQNWQTDADLARAYINWSGYAYTSAPATVPVTGQTSPGEIQGHSAPEAFDQRLAALEIVLHNQDNREHDLLDADDYYQFQGGLVAAVKSRRGQAPTTYFGDHAVPERPRVRSLKAEIARVYRSRVVNPKWIAGVMRHGYKGAFEMAATLDYLFAYDATTGCVEDHMYRGLAQAYLLDPAVRDFVANSNPWALRDMAERLLEAHQRQLWQGADDLVDALRAITHDAEAQIEQGFSGMPSP